MGRDQYRVDILHYINPHLIWVLVRSRLDENSFHFEQIGIYGVLPKNVSFGVDCVLKCEPCEQWMPAASLAMSRAFHGAFQVWFSPASIVKKSSVFHDNTQKFGDLVVVKPNGDIVNVLVEIVNSGFGYADEIQFCQELRNNSFELNLNYIALQEVTRKIEEGFKSRGIPQDIWLNAIKNQTSVQHENRLIESAISIQESDITVDEHLLLKNNTNILNLCQDIDEVSVGRACSPRNSSSSSQSSGVSMALRKKLEWLEAQSIANRHKQSSRPETSNSENPLLNVQSTSRQADEVNSNVTSNDDVCAMSANTSKGHFSGDVTNKNVRKRKISHSSMDNSRLVAFGPAGLQLSKFIVKPEATTGDNPNPSVQETRELEPESNTESQPEYQEKKSEDVYANTDSEVKLTISNLALLQQMKSNTSVEENSSSSKLKSKGSTLNAIRRKVKYLEEKQAKINDTSSIVSDKDNSKCDIDSDNESVTGLEEKLGLSINKIKKHAELEQQSETVSDEKKRNVNPFKNIDGSISIFVDKLVSPILMVHTKKNNRIEPVTNMRDIPFGDDIHVALRNMEIQKPMRPQTVSWPTILRGHSFFLVGPCNSGNTIGYLPAVCRLVQDFKNTPNKFGLSCIIVCATSHSVAAVESHCKMFLHSAKIFACYTGMSDLHITTSLLNGCDLLICTPTILVRLIQDDSSIDFRSLSTFVIDDCEHISSVYQKELKYCLLKVKDIVKNRVHKEWKVQYVVISRIWCDFMSSLARKAPDSVVCISAFQECVLYSKAATSVDFVAQENKLTTVINFLKGIDKSKKTVIVCRADDEVKLLEKALTKLNYIVFSCNSTMTVQDLYNLDKTLRDYEEPVLGPILVCCDGNLTHLNVTDAHYLIQYSLPDLFSMFCKRFAVLNDNYPSVFKNEDSNVKIKILFDNNNIKQLPKILQFIKRCTQDVPPFLDEISASVMTEKYLKRAQNFVPICGRLLTLGKCPDYWNCFERHAIFKELDSPKPWLPKEGIITFHVLHYHSAVCYSARVTSCVVKSKVIKYPQTYSLLSIKMGMHYSKDENKRLHGVPKVGDVCAVTLKQNLFVRCQVFKVLGYKNNQPTYFLIKLIDEERYETARDTSLYYLPDDLKEIETHVVAVILANLIPQDKDVTFSNLAQNQLKRITDENDELYMRGHITMVVGNTILVDTLEACQDLSSLEEVVVKCDFRKELLDSHAIPNPDHIDNLRNVCDYNCDIPKEKEEESNESDEVANPVREESVQPEVRWAHLESDGFSSVFFMYAKNPSQFFVRLCKFDNCINTLIKDIKKYMSENPEPIDDIVLGDIVIAEFPDDGTHERARIEWNVHDTKVQCFFVDQAEWREVSTNKLFPMPVKFITQLPFQTIECRLIGVKPPGDSWNEFSTNFFVDSCYDSGDNLKQLFTKYFTKEESEFTEGHKYGVVLIDTYSAEDIIINKVMIDKNLAEENEETKLLNSLGFERNSEESSNSDVDDEPTPTVDKIDKPLLVNDANKLIQYGSSSTSNKLIRSVPLVDLDDNFDNFDLVPDDSGNVCSIPISEVIAMKPFPVPQRNDKTTLRETQKHNIIAVPDTQKNNTIALPDTQKNNTIALPDTQKNVIALPDTKRTEKALASPIAHSASQGNTSSALTLSTESTDQVSKPKVLWRQNKNTVTIKIKLIADAYKLTLRERSIEFSSEVNNTKYKFDFETYGVVDLEKCLHCNKGQYIEVKLSKIIATKWLSLTRHKDLKKWIAYDTDSIEVSSDEEEEADIIDHRKNLIKNDVDSDSDDNMQDDISFSY